MSLIIYQIMNCWFCTYYNPFVRFLQVWQHISTIRSWHYLVMQRRRRFSRCGNRHIDLLKGLLDPEAAWEGSHELNWWWGYWGSKCAWCQAQVPLLNVAWRMSFLWHEAWLVVLVGSYICWFKSLTQQKRFHRVKDLLVETMSKTRFSIEPKVTFGTRKIQQAWSWN